MRLSLLLVATILILAVVQFPAVNSQSPQLIAQQGFGLNRSASLTVKIVFLGITPAELNSTYLTSNVTLPALKYQNIIAGPLNTGVIYNFHYQLVFANASTTTKFANYLMSIQKEEITTATSAFVNPYFDNYTTLSQARNYVYDADKVQSWLESNMTLFGASPIPGYTLFVADLHNFLIPSFSYAQYQAYNLRCTSCPPPSAIVTPHYYNRTITDPDLSLVNYRHYMTGWGGSSRFYYMDLSAGPSSRTNELPVQVASQLRGVDTSGYYSRLWMSEFVGSYVFGAVYDLFAADQLYPVNYTQTYKIQLFVVDNRTLPEMSNVPLKRTCAFGVPVKEDVALTGAYHTFAGEALGDMVLIGLSQSDFMLGNRTIPKQTGKGDGFSHAAIHELGHMIGLNHPFIYDLTEDFTNTVMGYYAYSLNYSQFDRDTILRGVNDELLSFALQALSSTQNTLFNSGDISMANQNIAQAENLYNTMDYAGAVPYSLAAAEDASAAQQLANSAISPALVFGLIGVAIGAAIGILLDYLIFRRRKPAGIQYNQCPTCQQPLRWDPAQMRWYCDRCQKPV